MKKNQRNKLGLGVKGKVGSEQAKGRKASLGLEKKANLVR